MTCLLKSIHNIVLLHIKSSNAFNIPFKTVNSLADIYYKYSLFYRKMFRLMYTGSIKMIIHMAKRTKALIYLKGF